MEYLSPEAIIRINSKLLGDQSVLRDRALLESAAARSIASAFGTDAYPTLHEKAAALIHSLVLNHPFVDGNKRTGTLAMLAFLKINGYVVQWPQEEALELIIAIAEGRHDVPTIARWLEINLVRE